MTYAPRPQSPEEWLNALEKEFRTESDRGAALVAAAMLDDALRELLGKHLVKPDNKDRDLLGRSKPLGTFSARIDAAFQVGLVSAYLARDLHLIRQIRNEFAHHPLECTFQSARVVDWVKVLERASDYNRRKPETRASVGPPGTRWDFLGMVGWILYNLHLDVQELPRLQPRGPEFGYIDWDNLPAELKKLLPEETL
jgi:DNA-binding MltR family transcriptional regulator